MKQIFISLFILLVLSGCGEGLMLRSPIALRKGAFINAPSPEPKPVTPDIKAKLVEETKDTAGKGLTTVWALSESNKLVFLLIVFSVIAGGIAIATRLKVAWGICILNVVFAVGVVLLTLFAEAMLRHIWLLGLVLVILTTVGLAFLALKFFIVAKEEFGYGETLKLSVNEETRKMVGAEAKAKQPKFVRDTIKWFRKS